MDSKGAIGIIVIATGLVQMVGSITGNEAMMLAALFDPSLLQTTSGAPAKPKSAASGFIGSITNTLGHLPVIP